MHIYEFVDLVENQVWILFGYLINLDIIYLIIFVLFNFEENFIDLFTKE